MADNKDFNIPSGGMFGIPKEDLEKFIKNYKSRPRKPLPAKSRAKIAAARKKTRTPIRTGSKPLVSKRQVRDAKRGVRPKSNRRYM